MTPEIVELGGSYGQNDLWIHDEKDFYKAQILARIYDDPKNTHHFPRPFGVFYEAERPCYEDLMATQIEDAQLKSEPDLDRLLRGREVWTINE